jgi:signal transduction histidine kinase/ActR/RegA family two-component response regulator
MHDTLPNIAHFLVGRFPVPLTRKLITCIASDQMAPESPPDYHGIARNPVYGTDRHGSKNKKMRRRRHMRSWWSNAQLRTKGFIVLAIPLLALIAVTVPGIYYSSQIDSYVGPNRAVNAAAANMTNRLGLLLSAETGMRGYAATLSPVFLAPFNVAIKDLAPVLNESNTRNYLTTQQGKELKTLGLAEMRELGSIETGVGNHSLSPTDLVSALLREQSKMQQIRTVIGAALARDQVMIARYQGQITSDRAVTSDLYTYGLIVGVLGGAVAMFLFLTGIVRRLRQVGENAERLGQEHPLVPLPPSKDAIGQLDAELGRTSLILAQRHQEIVAARDEAIRATEAKDTFVSRMSHELKTPLSAVVGFGELLQQEALSEENVESVNHIVKAGYHLLDLINDILDLSLVQTGHLTVSVEPLVLADVVAEAVSLVSPLAAKRHLSVTVEGMDGFVVAADRQRLYQVLLNFLSNAIKYNRENGSIVISAATHESTVRISVTDSGVGIPPDGMDRLFLPFERLQMAGQRISGTGVGLSVSKALAEAMGGSIGAESELSVGSSFWIELPADTLSTREIPDERPATRIDVLASTPENAGCVLFVEDNMAALRLFQRTFKDRSESLEVAQQGEVALLLARRLHPRLIFLDMHLPDMSGEDVLRQVKADPSTAGIPVIMVSAETSTGDRDERLRSMGAVACLQKPLRMQQIKDLLSMQLDLVSGAAAGSAHHVG